MEFENNIAPPQTFRSKVHDHLPVILLVGGVAGVFLGLHGAATGLVAAAAVHAVLGLIIVGIQRMRHQSKPAA